LIWKLNDAEVFELGSHGNNNYSCLKLCTSLDDYVL
jgi:hypothetical protein